MRVYTECPTCSAEIECDVYDEYIDERNGVKKVVDIIDYTNCECDHGQEEYESITNKAFRVAGVY